MSCCCTSIQEDSTSCCSIPVEPVECRCRCEAPAEPGIPQPIQRDAPRDLGRVLLLLHQPGGSTVQVLDMPAGVPHTALVAVPHARRAASRALLGCWLI